MTIPSIDAFVLLLYLLPGFLAMQLYSAKYPAKRISQFEVIVWSVLHSFIVLIVLGGLARVFRADDLNLLTRNADATGVDAGSIAVLLAAGGAWGLIWSASNGAGSRFLFYLVLIPRLSGRSSLEVLTVSSSGCLQGRNKDAPISAGLIDIPLIPLRKIMSSCFVLPSWSMRPLRFRGTCLRVASI